MAQCVRVQLTLAKTTCSRSQGTREPGAGVALKGSWAGMPWQSAAQLAEKVVNWNLTISKSV